MGKIMMGADKEVRRQILEFLHDNAIGGHSSIAATFQRLCQIYYWRKMKVDVHNHIRHYEVCQKCNIESVSSPGLLQPLPIPDKVWQDISLDFIEGLPVSSTKSVILVVVDRLSKYAHFITLKHPYTAAVVAQVYMDNVYKLHGLPQTIVSDRDVVFLSKFWQSLFEVQGVQFHCSTAYHL